MRLLGYEAVGLSGYLAICMTIRLWGIRLFGYRAIEYRAIIILCFWAIGYRAI